jgi:hypothetical protein
MGARNPSKIGKTDGFTRDAKKSTPHSFPLGVK